MDLQEPAKQSAFLRGDDGGSRKLRGDVLAAAENTRGRRPFLVFCHRQEHREFLLAVVAIVRIRRHRYLLSENAKAPDSGAKESGGF